jgi:hypothetical protein
MQMHRSLPKNFVNADVSSLINATEPTGRGRGKKPTLPSPNATSLPPRNATSLPSRDGMSPLPSHKESLSQNMDGEEDGENNHGWL